MTNRNAYPNAMRCGTLLSTPRPDAQHRATPLVASQRNSTICLLSTLHSARLPATPLYSAHRNDLFFINASRRSDVHRCATQLYSTICFLLFYRRCSAHRTESIRGSLPLNSPPRAASPLNDLFITTQCVSSRLPAAHRASTRLNAPQRNSKQRFVYYQRNSAMRIAPHLAVTHRLYTPRSSTQRNSTICLLLYQRNATQRTAPPLDSTRRFVCYFFIATLRSSTQCNASLLNDLFFTLSPLRIAAPRIDSQLYSTICLLLYYLIAAQRNTAHPHATQRHSTLLNDLFIHIASQLDNARRHATQLISTQRFVYSRRGSTKHVSTNRHSTRLNATQLNST